MLKTHTTKSGVAMRICQMEDSHLDNTIKMIVRKIEEAKLLVRSNINADSFTEALYEVDIEAISNRAKEVIPEMTEILYPYLAEAMLRGKDYSLLLQEAFERDSREGREIPAPFPHPFDEEDDIVALMEWEH